MPTLQKLFLFIAIVFFSNGCVEIKGKFNALPPGVWRGVLQLDAPPKKTATANDDITLKKDFSYQGELPFNFNVVYNSQDSFYIEIINGSEKIMVSDIQFARDRSTAKDTVIIDFPIYDSHIEAIFEENVMEGNWVVRSKNDYAIPFMAHHGRDHRFPFKKGNTSNNLSGKWAVTFEPETPDEYPAVGEFEQNGNKLVGTFLTETGDYRFLEGIVDGNKMMMSCFDGSHAFLFEAKIMGQDELSGTFRSGKHYTSSWTAVRKEDASIGNAFDLTFVESTENTLDNFEFKNEQGKLVRLDNDRYNNKVTLIQIMGTWCPNCRDESNFLKSYLKDHPQKELEVIAVGFEKYKEESTALKALAKYKSRMSLPYEVVYGGYASKKLSSETFPMLNKIISYPTLLFLDKNKNIRKVHTGFAGPATSEYEKFEKEFNTIIDQLLSEE